MTAYSQIYEYLNDPVDGHSFVLPYNQSTVAVTGRVEEVSDAFVRLQDDGQYWKDIRFTLIANHPTNAMSLNEVIIRGRTQLPPVSTPQQGVYYIWDGRHWTTEAAYRDADVIAY